MDKKNKQLKIIYLAIITLTMSAFTLSSSIAQSVLTLEKALEVANENSPDIKAVLLNLERSQQNLNAQQAALKSNFSLSLNPINYSQNRTFNDLISDWNTNENLSTGGTFTIAQPIKLTGGTVALNNSFGWQSSYSEYSGLTNKTFSNNLYLIYDQPIFTYNRTTLALKELELDLENTRLSYAMQKLSLEKNVTQAFYSVYQTQMNLQISQEEFNNQETSYNIIKNKAEGGLVAREELYQAELNMATSKSDLENKKVALENAKDQFKLMLGISLFDEIMILADVEISTVNVDLQKALDYGLAQRMELRQREINIENSQFNLIQTSAMNEFKGNLSLSVGIIGDDKKFTDVYENPTSNPRVSLSFQIPLYDWGEKEARIKAAEAGIKSSELSLDNQNNSIIIGIRTVYRNLQNYEDQIEIARIREQNAQLTYDINAAKYQNGDITGLDLNLIQSQLSTAKTSYSNSLISYKIELLNLKIQSLWDFENNISYIPIEFSDLVRN